MAEKASVIFKGYQKIVLDPHRPSIISGEMVEIMYIYICTISIINIIHV